MPAERGAEGAGRGVADPPRDLVEGDVLAAQQVLRNGHAPGEQVFLMGAFEATPMATVREVFETNTFGVMAMTQAVVPQLRARRSGVVVNVTSSATLAPFSLVAVYTASKMAIEGFTASLARPRGDPPTSSERQDSQDAGPAAQDGHDGHARTALAGVRTSAFANPVRRYVGPLRSW